MFCGVFGYFQLTTSCRQPVTFCHGFKRLQFVTGSNPSVVRFYRTTTTIFKQFISTSLWVFQQKFPFFHDFLSKKLPLFHGNFSIFCHFSMTFLLIFAVFPQKKHRSFLRCYIPSRARRIRTADLNVPNVARYQLRYCP